MSLKLPIEIIYESLSSVLGRSILFSMAVVLPYAFFAMDFTGMRSGGSVGLIVPVVLFSIATGWGLLVYPPILILLGAYIRLELSHWILLIPLGFCSLDLYRIVILIKAESI